MKYRNTRKTAALREPKNHWIVRTVWAGDDGKEYVRINGFYTEIDWFYLHGWDVDIAF